MTLASQLRAGQAIRFEGETYKVVSADYHPGQGKMGGVTHARLQNLNTGTFWEHSFRSDLKLEDLPLEKQSMEFLYADGAECFFMNPETFDQVGVPTDVIGPQAQFLLPQMRLSVEFLEERPVGVLFPEMIEIRVADTAPPVHAQQDSTWKTAKLANGVEVMVPQFIKTGDTIRLDLLHMKYMDRVKVTAK